MYLWGGPWLVLKLIPFPPFPYHCNQALRLALHLHSPLIFRTDVQMYTNQKSVCSGSEESVNKSPYHFRPHWETHNYKLQIFPLTERIYFDGCVGFKTVRPLLMSGFDSRVYVPFNSWPSQHPLCYRNALQEWGLSWFLSCSGSHVSYLACYHCRYKTI